MKKTLAALTLLASFSALPVHAATASLTEKNISLQQANELASAVIQSCSAKKYNVSVTVVDRGGNVKAVQRMDNAGPHSLEASRMKAFTALSMKNASGKVMEASQANAGAANLRDIPGLLLLAGGLPLRDGDQVIGAVGVGGAPAGNLDEQCAQAAIDSVFKG
ncbi:GlcG/HbpS family heme-binding protein [Erwinia sp.]|uniref:GlcG/HbpS family heme-binding protein n=1 Tax=Erwinia citreus TaxID=558 RepID=UPI003C77E66C